MNRNWKEIVFLAPQISSHHSCTDLFVNSISKPHCCCCCCKMWWQQTADKSSFANRLKEVGTETRPNERKFLSPKRLWRNLSIYPVSTVVVVVVEVPYFSPVFCSSTSIHSISRITFFARKCDTSTRKDREREQRICTSPYLHTYTYVRTTNIDN